MKCWSEHIIFLEYKPESYTVKISVAFHDCGMIENLVGVLWFWRIISKSTLCLKIVPVFSSLCASHLSWTP